MTNSLPLLSICLGWPLLGALLLLICGHRPWLRSAALAISLIELALTLWLLQGFDASQGGFQWLEEAAWMPGLNIRYQLGVDGISILFLPLTAGLTTLSIAAGWRGSPRLPAFKLALLLILESISIGVFCALDLVLFFLFWELTLPPLFFLIGLWGIGANRRSAAMKYVLYMLFGGVPLLFAIILLAGEHLALSGSLSFSLPQLLETPLPPATQNTVFLLMLLGFAVKTPLLPLHTWLPTTALEAPPQVSALLVGLKLGVYGLIRFAIALAPDAALQHRWLLAILGTLTLVYGALLALRQSNLRQLLAYAGVSHVGLVVLALASFTLAGVQGALMQLVNFGIIASSLMLIAGMLQQRYGSSDSLQLGGLAKPLPRLTTLFFLFALSSLGIPGGNGFPAELLMLLGILQTYPALAVVVLMSAVLAAAYLLSLIAKLFFGPSKPQAVSDDLQAHEWWLLVIPALLVLILGFQPNLMLSQQQASIEHWLNRLPLSQTIKLDLRATGNLDQAI